MTNSSINFLRYFDKASCRDATNPRSFSACVAAFLGWIFEDGESAPRAESGTALVAAMSLLSILERKPEFHFEERLTAEIVCMAVLADHPILGAIHEMGLLDGWIGVEGNELEPWEGTGRTIEGLFVHKVVEASPALALFYCDIAGERFGSPLMRNAIDTQPIVERILTNARATSEDHKFLADALLPLLVAYWGFEDDHLVSVSHKLDGVRMSGNARNFMKSSALGTSKMPEGRQLRRHYLQVFSALELVKGGNYSLISGILESTIGFATLAKGAWLGNLTAKACCDEKRLKLLGRTLSKVDFGPTLPRGDHSLDQRQRTRLKQWLAKRGKFIAGAVKLYRRWAKKVRNTPSTFPKTPGLLPDDAKREIGDQLMYLRHAWPYSNWLKAKSETLYPNELAIAIWLDHENLISHNKGMPISEVQRRARHAWRDTRPDRLKMKREHWRRRD